VDPLHLAPLDPRYPSRLCRLRGPPATISTLGGSLEAERAVAVVGSRQASADALSFARALAGTLARAGIVVVSGGAVGIDAAAHEGALDLNGRTWAVAGTGCRHCFPPEHASLFERIGASAGAMVWPFAPDRQAHPGSFTARNRVLVAMSDAVIVVQAGPRSGALNAAAHALKLMVPLWVVPVPPWFGPGFDGSRFLLENGGRALHTIDALLVSLGVKGVEPPPPAPPRPLSASEAAVFQATSTAPLHLDEIASRAQCPAGAVGAALLTLALENVVVEGPPGFFRRPDAHKR